MGSVWLMLLPAMLFLDRYNTDFDKIFKLQRLDVILSLLHEVS